MNFIKNMMNTPESAPDLGARIDTRDAAAKKKDYHFEEIVVSAAPVNWQEKGWDDVRQFPVFDQDGSGSCVAQTLAKLLGILYWLKNNTYVHFSATHIYQRRSNRPSGGMIGVNALDIAREGTTLEDLVPSQRMSDSEMDGIQIPLYKRQVGEIFKIHNYVLVPTGDIDTIASIIQETGKGVMVWFYFKSKEWKREIPQVMYAGLPLAGAGTARHSVTATDFLLHNGKKALVIEDSWGVDTGNEGRRIITEDFFKARNWFAAYPINFKFDDQSTIPSPQPNKPQHRFDTDLLFEQRNEDIIALQNILKYEGLFPNNVGSTGYYGSITAKAVYDFQVKHNVASMAELDELEGRICGVKTRAKLNELYA